MIIKKLELVNFQTIKEFNADFEGNIYFVTGENELGKSTLLKAIGALLTGNRDAVLRNGESKGHAKMIVGDDGEQYTVELRFTAANPRGTLTIKQEATGMLSNNVSMLQKIFGYTDFDAVEFSRWSETAEGRRKQIDVVKSLLPHDVEQRIAEIDAEVANIKAERTGINRDLKTFDSMCAAAEKELKPGDIEEYAERRDMADLMAEQQNAMALIEREKTIRAAREKRVAQLAEIPARLERVETERQNIAADIETERGEIENKYTELVAAAEQFRKTQLQRLEARAFEAEERAKNEIAQIKQEAADFEMRKNNADEALHEIAETMGEIGDISARFKEAEEHNRINALVEDFKRKRQQRDDKLAEAATMDATIKSLAVERAGLVENAKLPIPDLSFSEDGLTLKGVPFVPGKVSDSQIMEVAVRLVIASNPTVKVFRIARGESLGTARMRTIFEIAKQNGFQGFVEEVRRGQDDLIIEEYTERE